MGFEVDFENMFVSTYFERYKSANFECLLQRENIPFDEPTAFGRDFAPRGLLKFLFVPANSPNGSDIVTFCSPYLFIVKELSRRLQYNVSAVYTENNAPPIPFSPDEEDGLNLLYHEDVDIYFDVISMTPSRFRYLRPTYFFRIEPLYYILGSKYPKSYDIAGKFYQTFNTFDKTFWFLLLVILVTLPFLTKFVNSLQIRYLRAARRRRSFGERNYFSKFVRHFGRQTHAQRRVVVAPKRRSFEIPIFVKQIFRFFFSQWTVFLTALICAQNLNSRTLRAASFRWLYVIVFTLGFFVTQIFSSNMHLLLIFPPFENIDSINDLQDHRNLELITFLDRHDQKHVTEDGSTVEKEVFGRARIELTSFVDMLQNIKYYLQLIDEDRSHVFLASRPYMDSVRTADEYLRLGESKATESSLYLSTAHAFKMPTAIPFRKNLDDDVADTFREIVAQVAESGCAEKWLVEGPSFGGKMMAKILIDFGLDWLEPLERSTPKTFAQVWERFVQTIEHLLVALVFYVLGNAIAFIVYVCETLFGFGVFRYCDF